MKVQTVLSIVAFALALPWATLHAQARVALPQAASASPGAPVSPTSSGVQPPLDYHLHLSDRLELQFPFSSEYNETVSVQPDGRISLREVDPISVAGKSLVEVQTLIQQSYSGILKDPHVSILLKDFLAPSFYASGEVGRPGRYELHSDITLLQAISEAGGMLNERARKKEIVVFRPQGNGTYQSKVINLKAMLEAKASPQEDYAVFPGDIIYVPQNRFSKVQKYLPTTNVGTYVAPSVF